MILRHSCFFSLVVISIINSLISDDGDFACCHVISEMQNALKARLPFYEWRFESLLHSHDHMAMMKAMPVKVEHSNKISPLLHPYTFNAFLKSQFNFTYNLDELYCFGCVVVYLKYVKLGGQSCPQIPFFHLSIKKNALGMLLTWWG